MLGVLFVSRAKQRSCSIAVCSGQANTDWRESSITFKRADAALILILHPRKFVIGRQIGNASIPVVVSIVMVPMMVTVPAVPSIFFRLTIMAVAVTVVIVRSVLLVSGVNVNAESNVCFGFGRCQGHQPKRRQPQEEISFPRFS